MISFSNLKKYICSKIDAATTLNVYSLKIPQNTTNPYPCIVVYFYNIDNPSLIKQVWIIELHYWNSVNSDSVDSSSVLTAVEAVKAVMNGGWQVESDGFFRTYLENEREIPEPQPGVYHYYQQYICELR